MESLERGISLQGYTNDPNGNTLSGGGRTMTWDSQNRMVSCVNGTGVSQKTSSFTYGTDGLRRRMSVTSSTGNYTTDYVLDGNKVVQELTTTPSNVNPILTATYLSGPSGPLYKRPANSADVRWYVYDGGGNVTGEVDALGNLTSSKKHDVYGATRSSSGTAISKHGWQGGVGHQSDEETGLVYMRARYYAPELGRFQSEDPKLDGINWFAYCGNDPVNFVDESGKEKLKPWEIFLMTLGLSAAGIALACLILLVLEFKGRCLPDALASQKISFLVLCLASTILMGFAMAGNESYGVDKCLSFIGATIEACSMIADMWCESRKITYPGVQVAVGAAVLHAMAILAACHADKLEPFN
jgi:RHS repeat-associated protein